MENNHYYEIVEIFDDGIKLLECPDCGAAILFRSVPPYRKRLGFGDPQAGHIYAECGIGGLSFGTEVKDNGKR